MTDHLQGLNEQERAACLIAEKVLGAVAEPWDVDGRQGVVDAMLTLADGRRAAFEVTALAGEGALQLSSLLGKDSWEWDNPGRWWWTITAGSARDLPRLKQVYGRVIEMCETAGTPVPEHLWDTDEIDDENLTWLVEHSSSTMRGAPDVPSREGDLVRRVMVTPSGRGGGTDRSLRGLCAALTDVFDAAHMPRHLGKLARAEADERHLFIPLHLSALPFAVSDGLTVGDQLPPNPPPLPAGITHLWLAPQYGRRVLLWTPTGWQQHHPYD